MASVVGTAQAATWTLDGPRLQVRLDDLTGTFNVVLKESGRVWQEVPAGSSYAVESASRNGDKLVLRLKGDPSLTVSFRLTSESDLVMSIDAAPGAKASAINYPGPLAAPSMDWNLVLPFSEGILLPARQARSVLGNGRLYPIYAMKGLIMPWVGLTDARLKAGYMMIIDTPFDAAVAFPNRKGALAPAPVWLPQFGRFGYERQVRYHFFEAGGYVAQARHYRDYVRGTHGLTTLRQREAKRPAISRLIGAVHIYLWAGARDSAFVRGLKEAGIDRAWIGWDPSHPPYPAPGFDQAVEKLGYLSGVYDLYRDIYDDRKWAAAEASHPALKGLWLDRYVYPGLFEKIVARDSSDSPMEIAYSPDVGLMRYWVCTEAIQPYVRDRITRELKTYPHDSIFIDVTLAANLFECHSPSHPMTRREDAACRLAIHRYMADDLGLVVGSEWGADYGLPFTDFVHGVMTLHEFFGKGAFDRSSTYFRGDFDDTERPSMVLGECRATPEYLERGLGEALRIPLYELVYHGCVVSSWRWDDDSFKEPEAWAKKDLFNALYGTAPLWNLDKAVWEKYRTRLVASYRRLAPVLRAVGTDEMTDHRFLTADRTVQETVFSSGHRVIANFGSRTWQNGNLIVAPGEFVMTDARPKQ